MYNKTHNIRLVLGMAVFCLLLIFPMDVLAQRLDNLFEKTSVSLSQNQRARHDSIQTRPYARNTITVQSFDPARIFKSKKFLISLDRDLVVNATTYGYTEYRNGDITWVGALGDQRTLQTITVKGDDMLGLLISEGVSSPKLASQ